MEAAAAQSTAEVDVDGPVSFRLRKAMMHLHLAAEVRRIITTPQQEIQQLIDERCSMQQAIDAVLARIGGGVESLSGEDAWEQNELIEAACTKLVTPSGLTGNDMDTSVATEDGTRGNPVAGTHVAASLSSVMLPCNTEAAGEGTDVVASKGLARHSTVGWHQQRPRVIADKPQEFSDDSDEHIDDDLSRSNDGHSSSSEAEGADVLALSSSSPGGGDPVSSNLVHRLLSTIKVDKRMKVLEDLECDFVQRQAGLQRENQELEDMEADLQTQNEQAEQTSADLLLALDLREASIYRVLRRYGNSISGLLGGKLPMTEPSTICSDAQEIDNLHVPDGGLLHQQHTAGFRQGSTKNAQVILKAVSAIQEHVDVLRQAADMETSQLQAWEHAERELNNAAQSASEAPLSDPVVVQIIQEVPQTARLSSNEWRGIEGDILETQTRLTTELGWLRGEVKKEAARDAAVAAGVAEKDLPKHSFFARLKRRRKTTLGKGTRYPRTPLVEVGESKIKNHQDFSSQVSRYELFGTHMQQKHETEITILRERCEQLERQIRDMQVLKQKAVNSVPVIQHCAQRWGDILQLARRTVQVGELPPEENRAERLLMELRKGNEDVDRKQKLEHAREMQNLQSLERQSLSEKAALEERLMQLPAELRYEERMNKRNIKELEWLASRAHDAVERLGKVEILHTEGAEEEYTSSLHTAEKMNGLLEEQKNALKEALSSTANSAKLFEEVRTAAAKLLSNKAAELNRDSFETIFGSNQQEDQSEEQDEMEEAMKTLCTEAAQLLGSDMSHSLKLDHQGRSTPRASRKLRCRGSQRPSTDRSPPDHRPTTPVTRRTRRRSTHSAASLSSRAAELAAGDMPRASSNSSIAAELPAGDMPQQGTKKQSPKFRKLGRSATLSPSPTLNSPSTTELPAGFLPQGSSPQQGTRKQSLRPYHQGGSTPVTRKLRRNNTILAKTAELPTGDALLIEQKLKAAEKDESEANDLKAKTDELNGLAKAMEQRLGLALGLGSKKELATLLWTKKANAVVPESVRVLRQEVQAQAAELESFSRRWGTIRKVAALASKSGEAVVADADGDDLRRELGMLCGKALRYQGHIYVKKKEQYQAKAKSTEISSPLAASTEELASAESEISTPSEATGHGRKMSQSWPRQEALQE